MQYADNGDLYQKIKKLKQNKLNFSQEQIWKIFIPITKGLNVIHKAKILHRDLKSANIFLDTNYQPKIGDLNVAAINKDLCSTQTGTPYYACPEVWKDNGYDYKADIWSLGCILYELTTLNLPFKGRDMTILYRKIIKGIYPPISSKYSQDLSGLIKELLNVKAIFRPSCCKQS